MREHYKTLCSPETTVTFCEGIERNRVEPFITRTRGEPRTLKAGALPGDSRHQEIRGGPGELPLGDLHPPGETESHPLRPEEEDWRHQMKAQARARARQLAQEFAQRGEATGWFEKLYSQAQGNEQAIHWADKEAHACSCYKRYLLIPHSRWEH
jgi:hypothetical protein